MEKPTQAVGNLSVSTLTHQCNFLAGCHKMSTSQLSSWQPRESRGTRMFSFKAQSTDYILIAIRYYLLKKFNFIN